MVVVGRFLLRVSADLSQNETGKFTCLILRQVRQIFLSHFETIQPKLFRETDPKCTIEIYTFVEVGLYNKSLGSTFQLC